MWWALKKKTVEGMKVMSKYFTQTWISLKSISTSATLANLDTSRGDLESCVDKNKFEFTCFKISRTIKTQKERGSGGRVAYNVIKLEAEGSEARPKQSTRSREPCRWCLLWLRPPLVSDGNYSFSRISPLQDFGARLMYLLYCQIFPGQRLLIQKIYILSSFIM